MENQKVFVTGAIINSAIGKDEDPFVDFQTNPPAEENNEKRHYFESVAATTAINRNLYQFEPQALQMIASGFKQRKTLTINHEKGHFSNVLGFGATVDAIVVDDKLYVAAYVALGKTYPQGPFGDSEELVDGITDGFIDSVSQSAFPLKAKCSVCNLAYPTMRSEYSSDNVCRHYRGQQVIVEENGERVVKTVHVIIQQAEAIELSFVQMGADRGTGVTKKAINLSLNDFVDDERFEFLYGDDEQKQRLLEGSNPQPNNSGGDPPLNNNLEGEPEMSQETIQALQTRAETAETNAAKLQTELNSANGQVAVLTSQKDAVNSQVSSLETEKDAFQAQVDSANNEKDIVKQQLDSANESIKEKDKEITTLKQEAAENELVISDGKAARVEYEKEYVSAFVAAVGDDCTPADEELQQETAKSFSIEVLKKKTAGLKKAAVDNYPDGKKVTEEGKKPEEEKKPEEKSGKDTPYPIGV